MTAPSDSPLVVVCYDVGVVAPRRIAQAAREVGCRLQFVVPPSNARGEVRGVLERIGGVTVCHDADSATNALAPLEPQGILTFSEGQLHTTAHLAARLGLPHHDLTDLPAITQKGEQRTRFADHGIGGPDFRVVTSDAGEDRRPPFSLEGLRPPVVAKPVVGAGSRNTRPFDSIEACVRFLEEVLPVEGSMIVETMEVGLPAPSPWGCDLGVACVIEGGDVQVLATVNKLRVQSPMREWGGWLGPSPHPPNVIRAAEELAVRAVKALGVHTGMCDAEIRLTAEGPKVIEVNGRLAGWVDWLVARAGGVPPAETCLRLALGVPLTAAATARPEPAMDVVPFAAVVVPPVSATRVRNLTGLSRLRAETAIEAVELNAVPGTAVDWRLGLATAPATVFGAAKDLNDLAATLLRLAASDTVAFD